MENLRHKAAAGALGALGSLGSLGGLAASGCAGGQCIGCLACAGVGIAAVGAAFVMKMKNHPDRNAGEKPWTGLKKA